MDINSNIDSPQSVESSSKISFNTTTHKLLGVYPFKLLKVNFGAYKIYDLLLKNDYYIYVDTPTGNVRVSIPLRKTSYIFNCNRGKWYQE